MSSKLVGKRLQFIMKPTYSCNAACSYCSVYKKGATSTAMTTEIFDDLKSRIDKEFEDVDLSQSSATFIWLGGEPLLMSNKFFEHVYDKTMVHSQKHYLKYKHNMQTNLTLYNSEKGAVIKKLLSGKDGSFSLGSSYDPVSDERVLVGPKSYKKEFLKSYFQLKKDNGRLGCIYVVHKGALGYEQDIYRFFKNLGIQSFSVNSMSDFTGKYDEEVFGLTPKEQGEFFINMWKIWQEDNYALNISPFIGWKHLRDKGEEKHLRCHNVENCSKNLFGVGPDGSIYECDRNMQAEEAPLGSIYTDSFADLQKKKIFHKRHSVLKEVDCAGCEYWSYCKGGCPFETKAYYEGEIGKTYWCESYKMLFNYINHEAPKDETPKKEEKKRVSSCSAKVCS